MNHSPFYLLNNKFRRFNTSALIFSFWLGLSNLSAAPCGRTNVEKDAWVAGQIDALVRVARIMFENEEAQPRYERVLSEIASTIQRCRWTEDRDFVGRFPEFFEYVKLLSLATKEDHELGFEVPDRVYFAETSQYTTIPDFLLTPRFLRSVSRFESLPQAKAQLREMNAARTVDEQLLFLSYESRHLGTPDNADSFRRLLILVPGDTAKHIPEKWVQFGIPDPRARAAIRNVSVVAVVSGTEKTTNIYFKDYFRNYGRNGSITVKGRWEQGYGDDNCVECHKSGVLPIFPVNGSVGREEMPVLDEINERFLTYGPPRFDKYLDAKKFGPGLGSARHLPHQDLPDGSSEPSDLFRRAGSGTTVADAQPGTKACTSCHNANGLGAFNWPMDEVLISSFVIGGKMPLGAKLSARDRAKLYNQLVQDYFAIDEVRPGILKAWLLGKSREQ